MTTTQTATATAEPVRPRWTRLDARGIETCLPDNCGEHVPAAVVKASRAAATAWQAWQREDDALRAVLRETRAVQGDPATVARAKLKAAEAEVGAHESRAGFEAAMRVLLDSAFEHRESWEPAQVQAVQAAERTAREVAAKLRGNGFAADTVADLQAACDRVAVERYLLRGLQRVEPWGGPASMIVFRESEGGAQNRRETVAARVSDAAKLAERWGAHDQRVVMALAEAIDAG